MFVQGRITIPDKPIDKIEADMILKRTDTIDLYTLYMYHGNQQKYTN